MLKLKGIHLSEILLYRKTCIASYIKFCAPCQGLDETIVPYLELLQAHVHAAVNKY